MENFNKRQEYIAKFIGDLSKTIFAVGLASYLFKGFPAIVRIVCVIAFIVLMALSLYYYPEGGERC